MTKMREDELERRLDILEASMEDQFVSVRRALDLVLDLRARGEITTIEQAMEVLREPWCHGVFESEEGR
ncbi:MAG: hypothetical protein ACR2ND_00865 [Solirubrobacteraceae bacterium]